ncbi:MAG: protein translocase subunit SecF [Thermoanaerobaculia bacterium]
MRLFRDTHYRFMKHRRLALAIALSILVGAWIAEFIRGGLNLGIDFAGGTQLTLKFEQEPELDRLRRALADAGLAQAQIQRFGETEDNEVLIKTPILEGSEEGSRALVTAALAGVGDYTVLATGNVGPQVGAELRRKGILAVVFSMLGMLAYIWIRFELRFGIGALVATAHDVLITLALFALTRYEFNLTTVAAFLTLIGYSVNDTVVLFDRVRENMRRSRRQSFEEIVDLATNQTLSRTVLTSGTTLLATGSLLVFGGDVLRGFAFILTIGIIVGTFSSVYIASPFALWWERVFGKGARAERKERKAAL